MAWDAGAITGKLGLDISEFAHGMLEAQAVAAVFPSIVVEFMENPLLGLIQVAKESASAVREAVEQIAASFHTTGLEAEKAGVGVEFFSRLSAAAEHVGISAQSLGVSFRFLQEHMAAALEGDKQSVDGFGRLGISLEFIRDHINDTEGAFTAVAEAMDKLPNNAARVEAAMKLLGRSGGDMVPLFALGSAKLKEFGDTAASLGAIVGESQAKLGANFGDLEAMFSQAWEGIKAAVAEPILEALGAHADQIKAKLIQFAATIRAAVGPPLQELAAWMSSHPQEISNIITKMVDLIVKALELMGKTVLFVADHFDVLVDLLGAAGIGAAILIGLKALSLLQGAFTSLVPAIAAATTAQLAFNAARAGATGAGVGGAVSAASGGNALGGTIGGAAGAIIGSFIAPGIGTYIGGALGGAIGGWIGNRIEEVNHPKVIYEGGGTTVNAEVSVNFDPESTAAEMTRQIQPQLQAVHNELIHHVGNVGKYNTASRNTRGTP